MWGAWPTLGLGDATADVAAAQAALTQLQTILTGADAQLSAGSYDGAVAAYKTAGALAQNVVAPAISTAGGDVGMAGSSYAAAFAGAWTFLDNDNASLQQVASSADPSQPVATLDSAMGAQKIAYDALSQAQAMMGFVQQLRGVASTVTAPTTTQGHWVIPAVWLFVGGIVAAMVVHQLDERAKHRRVAA